MSWVSNIARPDIVALSPYEPASWEPGITRLHANELPWQALDDPSLVGLNRYPQPQAPALTARLADLYKVRPENLLICRGSDEAIDLLARVFCRAGVDAVLVTPPTFGMYAVMARIQGAKVVTAPLIAEAGFALDARAVLERVSSEVKLIFLCSPNNPTGNVLSESAIVEITEAVAGRAIVVVDEAYIEFSQRESLASQVSARPHLAVLRTLSKAHGLAGARLGALIAAPEVILLLRKIIAPYAVPQLIVEAVMELLTPVHLKTVKRRIAQLQGERSRMLTALSGFATIKAVFPSEANFLLARFANPEAALALAKDARLLVRDARTYLGLSDALRITIGAPEENDRLLKAWS
jgi:histidinol-phosphate aminotransferase